MTTPALNYIGDLCLAFSYHMRGQDMGTLNVYIQTGDIYTSSAVRLVFSRTGQQGTSITAWLRTSFTILTTSTLDRVRMHYAVAADVTIHAYYIAI